MSRLDLAPAAELVAEHPDYPAWAHLRYLERVAEHLDEAPPLMVATDFLLACSPLTAAQVAWLMGRGASLDALLDDGAGVGWPIMAGRAERVGRRYAFREDGAGVLVFVARDVTGDGVDLVAWEPREGWALPLSGDVALLGGQQLDPLLRDGPLQVHSSMIEWLRAERRGVVVVDQSRAVPLLRGVGPLLVDDDEFAARLHVALTLKAPKIMVRAA